MDGSGRLAIRTQVRKLERATSASGEDIAPGEYVAIEVADSGSGIAPEVLPRIFEPFFTTKEVGKGTGLGLATVLGIVKQSGGHMLVDTRPGSGTAFTVLLPRRARPAPARAVVEAPRRDLTGAGTILFVEDEEQVRKPAANALRNRGYTVMEADSGAHALELLEATPAVDLLITDVMMPEMDGATLVRTVRASRPNLKVVCISGHAEDAFRRELGAIADLVFLAKPFSLAELARTVKDRLAADKAA